MSVQIGDRVRTKDGALGVVQSVQDPQQIHVTLGEGVAESVRAYSPEDLTLAAESGTPVESPAFGAQDAARGGPTPESGGGDAGGAGSAGGGDAGGAGAAE